MTLSPFGSLTIVSGPSIAVPDLQVDRRGGHSRIRETSFAQGVADTFESGDLSVAIGELFKVGFQLNSFCEKLCPAEDHQGHLGVHWLYGAVVNDESGSRPRSVEP